MTTLRLQRGLDALDSSRGDSVISNSFPNLAKSSNVIGPNRTLSLRALALGLVIGVLICFCNIYFGLQTGWGSGMSMPSALIGFVVLRSISKYAKLPFTHSENVLVQTVAGAAGIMSLNCGFVGIIPAIEFLLKKDEGAPVNLETSRLILWSVGICVFGAVFAVALRKEIIIRQKLRFPTGTATALLIEVLHGSVKGDSKADQPHLHPYEHEQEGLLDIGDSNAREDGLSEDSRFEYGQQSVVEEPRQNDDVTSHVKERYVKFLFTSFIVSALYTILTYFVPQVRNLPILGRSIAINWLWTLNPSPAYIGQGAIMGLTTSLHMLIGAIIGWGILSPLAKSRGWASGAVDDWETGSRGWIMWIALALMLADSFANLSWLVFRPLVKVCQRWRWAFQDHLRRGGHWHDFVPLHKYYYGYSATGAYNSVLQSDFTVQQVASHAIYEDAPRQQQTSNTRVSIMLPFALLFCVLCVHFSFGSYITSSIATLATILTVFASVMGIRALGETDLLPQSAIGKLAQLLFSIIISKDNPSAVVANLLVGSISESGAGQAGDLMQNFKIAHLLQTSPKDQFYGQLIGSACGVILSPLVYRLYVSVYQLPSELFQMPSAYIWIFTARLVNGKGLPPMTWQFGTGASIIVTATTLLRIFLNSQSSSNARKLKRLVPGGIALAVGMYTTPSFSIPRAIGGILSWWYMRHNKNETDIVVVASGLILGEGIFSMLNLLLASVGVPHL